MGSIVEFALAWSAPGCHYPDLIWGIANALISGEFSEQGVILLLKAFPLEYEGRVTNDELALSRSRRQEAMYRYYRRKLGVTRLADVGPNAEWMWKRLHQATPFPASQQRPKQCSSREEFR